MRVSAQCGVGPNGQMSMRTFRLLGLGLFGKEGVNPDACSGIFLFDRLLACPDARLPNCVSGMLSAWPTRYLSERGLSQAGKGTNNQRGKCLFAPLDVGPECDCRYLRLSRLKVICVKRLASLVSHARQWRAKNQIL
jgi:hypothetical protein